MRCQVLVSLWKQRELIKAQWVLSVWSEKPTRKVSVARLTMRCVLSFKTELVAMLVGASVWHTLARNKEKVKDKHRINSRTSKKSSFCSSSTLTETPVLRCSLCKEPRLQPLFCFCAVCSKLSELSSQTPSLVQIQCFILVFFHTGSIWKPAFVSEV